MNEQPIERASAVTSDYGADYSRYQTDRSRLRRLVRTLYLKSAASLLHGRTLDVGCGAGELLRRLPDGSVGLDANEHVVRYCRSNGLRVDAYDGASDGWALGVVDPQERFESMVVSHVLEHLDDPLEALKSLLSSASRLGVQRALVVVPGAAGFKIDATHRTFVEAELIRRAARESGWEIAVERYFPVNARSAGKLIPHNELQVLLRSHT